WRSYSSPSRSSASATTPRTSPRTSFRSSRARTSVTPPQSRSVPRSLSERAWFGQLEEAITHETWTPAMSTSILVVEDEPAIQELLRLNLEDAGFTVHAV